MQFQVACRAGLEQAGIIGEMAIDGQALYPCCLSDGHDRGLRRAQRLMQFYGRFDDPGARLVLLLRPAGLGVFPRCHIR
jgi:hypothetical protein